MKDYKKVVQGGNEAYDQYVVVGHRRGQEYAYLVAGDEDGNRGVASLDMDALRGLRGAIDDILALMGGEDDYFETRNS